MATSRLRFNLAFLNVSFPLSATASLPGFLDMSLNGLAGLALQSFGEGGNSADYHFISPLLTLAPMSSAISLPACG